MNIISNITIIYMQTAILGELPLGDNLFAHWSACQRCFQLASSQRWPVINYTFYDSNNCVIVTCHTHKCCLFVVIKKKICVDHYA